MFSVKNKKIILTVKNKNGKVIKEYELKNRLLNNYLDYVIYKTLPYEIGNSLFTDIPKNSDNIILMENAYLKFDDTQVITDESVTMDYDIVSSSILVGETTMTTSNTTKTLTTDYYLNISSIPDNSLFTGIGFGRLFALDPTNYLFSFVDISSAGIRKTSDTFFYITRYDEMTTNLIGDSADYLPLNTFGNDGGTEAYELSKISTCYNLNGLNIAYDYDISGLTFNYVNNGEVDITGFRNFKNNTSPTLYPSITLYPSNSLFPSLFGQIKSVLFHYKNINTDEIITSYVNKQDLDISYDNTEFKIKIKCERGAY